MTCGQKARPVPAAEFRSRDNGEQFFVWLLYEHLYRHLKARGLAVDKKRKRAYFPRTEAGERPVPYQARLRRATRVVTKPVVSRTTQKVRYWEHKAFYFSFECFSDTWLLQILPGYVFTKGKYDLLNSERVTGLATRRASRDYNSHVHNNLVFWTWVVLSGGEAGSFALDSSDGFAYAREPQEKEGKAGRKRRREPVETILAHAGAAPHIVVSAALPTASVSVAPEPGPDMPDAESEPDEFPEIEEELARIIETTPEAERAR